MADFDPTMLATKFASDRELASTGILNDAYGFAVKESAAALGLTLGFDNTEAALLVGAFADSIEHLSFPERRLVSENLRLISQILGASAMEKTVLPRDTAVQAEVAHESFVAGPEQPEEEPQADAVDLPSAIDEADSIANEGAIAGPDITAVDETVTGPKYEATTEESLAVGETLPVERLVLLPKERKRYENILKKIFPEEVIAQASDDLLPKLLDAVIERYLGLKITRISAHGKAERIEQIRNFVEKGETFQEQTEKYGVARGVVWSGVNVALKGVAKRSTEKDIEKMVSLAKKRLQDEADGGAKQAEVQQTEVVETKNDNESFFTSTLEEFKLPEVLELVEGFIGRGDFATLAELFAEIYTNLPTDGINPEVKKEDASMLIAHIVERLSLEDLAAVLESDTVTIQKRIQRVCTYPFTRHKSTSLEKLSEAVGANQVAEPSYELEETLEPKEYSTSEAFEEIFNRLHVTLKHEAQVIKNILSPTILEVVKNGEANQMRSRISIVLDTVTELGDALGDLKLTASEGAVLREVIDATNPSVLRRSIKKHEAELALTSVDTELAGLTILSKLANILRTTKVNITL